MNSALIIVLVIVVIVAVWAISSYNGFVALRNKTEEAFSTMDVALKKRYDLIPNLVETVKGYAKHEQGTLQDVINARNCALKASTPEQKIAQDAEVSGSLKNLIALAESYPELKANSGFLALQQQLADIEDEIAASRRYYNGVVNKYNTSTEVFPGSVVAGMFHFERKPFYKVDSAEERQNVKVSF